MFLTKEKGRCDHCYKIVSTEILTMDLCKFCIKNLNLVICPICKEFFHYGYLKEKDGFRCPRCLEAWEAPVIPIEVEPEEPKDLDQDLQEAIDACTDTEKLDNLVSDVKEEEAANIGTEGIEAQVRFLLDETVTREDILHALKG